jgi:hypothetical protein
MKHLLYLGVANDIATFTLQNFAKVLEPDVLHLQDVGHLYL